MAKIDALAALNARAERWLRAYYAGKGLMVEAAEIIEAQRRTIEWDTREIERLTRAASAS